MTKESYLLKDEKERESQQRLLARNTLDPIQKNYLSDTELYSKLLARFNGT